MSRHTFQEVCPFNLRFAEEAAEPGYAARGPGERPTGVEALPGEGVSAETPGRAHAHRGTDAPSLVELLETALDGETWEAFSRGSAIRRAGHAGFARNVCVGLGNWGAAEAVPVLVAAFADPEPVVRAHAAWALGRVGSAEARTALSSRAAVESDESVADELVAALRR